MNNNRPRIFVPLAQEPWSRFAQGFKSVEVRNRGSPVAHQVRKAPGGTPVTLRLGYSGTREIQGRLGGVWEVDRWNDLPEDVQRRADVRLHDAWFDEDKPIVAFEVIL